jgi:hypothetical protein
VPFNRRILQLNPVREATVSPHPRDIYGDCPLSFDRETAEKKWVAAKADGTAMPVTRGAGRLSELILEDDYQ